MDARETLRDLTADAHRWHAKLAAWVGRNPKKTATYLAIATVLGGWKAVELVRWVL